ncbi:flagellar hook capping FlgD N-terminal domain-containing protein [Seohaeicola sp. SP36]|uniref:flagellar hook capping FlgD N-terminal domain-containing protein n=1 Tax=unclassified Seohaeicola TaxID=2641111 RepID=UPI00237C1B5B|nr:MULTISPECIES: flagellar hook capping FlgD N-terminal domain-containing protein [unclassified Seohaeicola]MDD9706746.1 flagellar hook capping FlgD N-terminal domain-containing protein [Seohaeicola sp. 4SK31]MDD9734452.1 flagellar hook capping FlgD N-terminal domain-containing protein [Seohaeicola sp. SP36]
MTTIDTLGPPFQTRVEPPAPKTVINSDFETFLKMLTAQLKNQDPLNPIESNDFAVQLATFSSVEQQVLTNDLLSGLSGQMGQMGMAQLAAWVGMEARAPIPARFEGFPVTLQTSPLATADSARLVVRNEGGNVVQTLAIPNRPESYRWSGQDASGQSLPPGLYSFEVESYFQNDLQGTSVPDVYDRIVEARSDAGRTILVMEGGATVDAARVTALRN